jgi:hypothetical protein
MFGVSPELLFEEPAMHVRFVLIAASLIGTGAFGADAPQAPVEPAAQPQAGSPPVVLASAEQVRTGSNADPQRAAAAKPARVARVTTCRCGGQNAVSDSQSDDQ